LGQLDSGQREPQRRTFPIRDLLERIKNTWAPLAREKELGFELPESQELVHSDPEMLGTILQHLVGNAIGHTDGGRVWIECRRRDEVLVIEVHDTGIGIPEDKLDAISRSSNSCIRRAAKAWASVCRSSGGRPVYWDIASPCDRRRVRGRASRSRCRAGVGDT
jgi:signal transduction histidine kinase